MEAALPGKAVVVFDPQRETIEVVVPSEDAHAQECSLLGQVKQPVSARQVRLEERDFCTEASVECDRTMSVRHVLSRSGIQIDIKSVK